MHHPAGHNPACQVGHSQHAAPTATSAATTQRVRNATQQRFADRAAGEKSTASKFAPAQDQAAEARLTPTPQPHAVARSAAQPQYTATSPARTAQQPQAQAQSQAAATRQPSAPQHAQPQPRPQGAATPQAHAAQPHPAAPNAPAYDDMPLDATASIFRRYLPLKTTGRGGFASVEKCLDTRLKRYVAIKRIPLHAEDGTLRPDDVNVALREAQNACSLNSPNIVTVHDFRPDQRYAYLIMEYVDGMSLAEFLRRVEGCSLTYDETAALAEALVNAVKTAHAKNVLHLDIKPANILIDRQGTIKLTDFGTAVLASAAGWADANGGTVGYMPPEQITDGLVDARSDLFSLATVIYEALCGTRPFAAPTPQGSVRKIKKGVTPPSELLPTMPASSEAALLRALSANAADRQASVEEFAEEFLPAIGNPATGRRSFEHMIAELTDDAEGGEKPAEEPAPSWEYDPELGYLGARWPVSERVAQGLVAAVSCGVSVAALVPAANIPNPAAVPVLALAVGAAAGVAPQIGSALVFGGLMLALASAAPLATTLSAGVLAFAALASWWLTWGRTQPAASAVVLACGAAALVTGEPLAGAGPLAVAAGYWLSPGAAAGSVGVGLAFAHLLATAASANFAPGPALLAQAFLQPRLLLAGALYTALAAGVSAGIRRVAKPVPTAGSRVLLGGICVSAGIVVVLLKALANPVEIAGAPGGGTLAAMGAAVLSTIIGGILMCAFGEVPRATEGERP